MSNHIHSHHLETLLIHGAYEPERITGATTPPIFQSTSFAYKTAEDLEAVFAGRELGYVYSRIGNPTVTAFEQRIAELEGGFGAVACSSGMAAISATVLALAGAGDEIVSGNSIFAGTYSLFSQTLKRYGITTRFVESTDIDSYRKVINERTKLIFLETIGNPKLDVPDIRAISEVARENEVPLVVDNTVTTPLLVQPKELGADIVIHSTSKFINGHGNAIGGIVVDCGSFDWRNSRFNHLKLYSMKMGERAFLVYLRTQICRDLGCCMSPFNAFLMCIGIESLGVRIERHCSNALRVAEYLTHQRNVYDVRYPGLSNHPDHVVAARQFGDRYGALVTLKLPSKEDCFKFINGLKLIQNLANIGDAKTLVIHPASTFCRDLSDEERKSVGVSDNLVRISVGIEHVEDVIDDIHQSLETIK